MVIDAVAGFFTALRRLPSRSSLGDAAAAPPQITGVFNEERGIQQSFFVEEERLSQARGVGVKTGRSPKEQPRLSDLLDIVTCKTGKRRALPRMTTSNKDDRSLASLVIPRFVPHRRFK